MEFCDTFKEKPENNLSFMLPSFCAEIEKIPKENENDFLNMSVSNPSKILLLCGNLTDRSSKALEVKINRYLMQETKSVLSFLIHLQPNNRKSLVQTLGTQELETSIEFPLSEEVMMQMVSFQDGNLKCDESLNDQILLIIKELFPGKLKLKYVVVPVLKNQNIYPCSTQYIQPELLACFINNEKNDDFVIKIANDLFHYCINFLLNTMEIEEERREKLKFKIIRRFIYKFLHQLEDINQLINCIKTEFKILTNAEICILYLKNHDHINLISKVLKRSLVDKRASIKSSTDFAIPSHVVESGKVLNVRNVAEHPLVSDKLSQVEGYKNILCFPLRNNMDIIGAVQLCNKKDGDFNLFDEEVTNILGNCCGLAIAHSLKHTLLENSKIRVQLNNELIVHKIQVSDGEISKKILCRLLHFFKDFNSFHFSPENVVQSETPCAILKMFDELGFFSKFGIKKDFFMRFVLSVKQACNEVPYHNWTHLFSAAHFAYLFLKKLQLLEKGYLTHLEALAYFISCLCHDVDYRGTNSWFQDGANNSLASLYSSPGSLMERYRLSVVLRILEMENCNFLHTFDRKNYAITINLLKDLILATDLAKHFTFYKKQIGMVKSGYNRNNPEHRYLFSTLLVTCADLSDYTKDWVIVKKIAGQTFEEFLTRGDLLKEIKLDPVKIPNVTYISFPVLQADFLKQVCLPSFKLLSRLFVELKVLVHKIEDNILYFETCKPLFERMAIEGLSVEDTLANQKFNSDLEARMKLLRNN